MHSISRSSWHPCRDPIVSNPAAVLEMRTGFKIRTTSHRISVVPPIRFRFGHGTTAPTFFGIGGELERSRPRVVVPDAIARGNRACTLRARREANGEGAPFTVTLTP